MTALQGLGAPSWQRRAAVCSAAPAVSPAFAQAAPMSVLPWWAATARCTTAKACKALQVHGCKAPSSLPYFRDPNSQTAELHPWGNSSTCEPLETLPSSLHFLSLRTGNCWCQTSLKAGLEAEWETEAELYCCRVWHRVQMNKAIYYLCVKVTSES